MTFPLLAGASEDVLSASLVMLRIGDGRGPKILFEDATSDALLYPANDTQLTDLITIINQTLPDNYFNKRHIYNIRLDFSADMSVRLYVNDWELKESGYEIIE